MSPIFQIIVGLLVVAATMVLFWRIARQTKNAGIVDFGWSLGVGILAVFFAATSDGDPARRTLVAVLGGTWSLRLAVYLLFDRVLGKPEEGRYVKLREQWGESAERNFLLFFLAQAGLALLFALPMLVVAHNARPGLGVWDWLGALLWLVAVGNTALADLQLARFRNRPENQGKTCRDGWWRFSRHPNYFFEWLHWWTYVLLAIGIGWWSLVPLAAPLVMLVFMLKVTGIPPTEAQAVASRGDDYRQYQETTSAFVPWLPNTPEGRRMGLIDLAEAGALSDWLIRVGIRRVLRDRLKGEREPDPARRQERKQNFLAELRQSPVTIEADEANRQHYEVPTQFFQEVLGPRLKYSCCLWPPTCTSLAEAEETMLELFCQRAEIEDGMEVLELGCGWGSLCLWIAEKYPGCRVLAVSNSATQREFIEARRTERRLENLEVQTADVAMFQTERRFDRVVSVEMFEHVRNYPKLLGRIAGWLKPAGKLAVHIFCHRELAYPFETEGATDWMGRHFFTGGIMPSDDLLLYFQRDMLVEAHWSISGTHYAKTLEGWLKQCDAKRAKVLPLFEAAMSYEEAARQLQRWRMFFMACAELFNYRGGGEWFVSHYRLVRR